MEEEMSQPVMEAVRSTLCPQLCQILIDCQNSLTDSLGGKFVAKQSIEDPDALWMCRCEIFLNALLKRQVKLNTIIIKFSRSKRSC